MRKDSVVFGVAGIFFGLLVGWIIGSQQAAACAAACRCRGDGERCPGAVGAGARRGAPRRCAPRPSAIRATPTARVQLGNLYFDAERFEDAVKWYEEAVQRRAAGRQRQHGSRDQLLLHEPARPRARPVRRSLAIDPKHSKTLLNVGIVRAFGKQDLDGAAKAFQQVLDVAPGSPEASAARQALDGLRGAHPDVPGGTAKQPGSQTDRCCSSCGSSSLLLDRPRRADARARRDPGGERRTAARRAGAAAACSWCGIRSAGCT